MHYFIRLLSQLLLLFFSSPSMALLTGTLKSISACQKLCKTYLFFVFLGIHLTSLLDYLQTARVFSMWTHLLQMGDLPFHPAVESLYAESHVWLDVATVTLCIAGACKNLREDRVLLCIKYAIARIGNY